MYIVPCSATENIKLFRTPCDELQTVLYIGEGSQPKIPVTCSELPPDSAAETVPGILILFFLLCSFFFIIC